MDVDTPKRPWHSRKRTWAAAALLLLVAYPPSLGPLGYCANRGWLPSGVFEAVATPSLRAIRGTPLLPPLYERDLNWWLRLGVVHREAASGRPALTASPRP